MKFCDLFKLFVWLCYCVLVPVLFTTVCVLQWGRKSVQLDRTMFCCCTLLFVRLENAITAYRLVRRSTAREYEATVLLVLVKTINSIEGDSLANYPTLFDRVCYYLFTTVLVANTVTYTLVFVTLFVYSICATVAHLRGRNIFGGGLQENGAAFTLNRGLTPAEVAKLHRGVYEAVVPEERRRRGFVHAAAPAAAAPAQHPESAAHSANAQEEVCSVCLCEYALQDEVIVLPECRHYFHADCVQTWLQARPMCPMCRNNVLVTLQAQEA